MPSSIVRSLREGLDEMIRTVATTPYQDQKPGTSGPAQEGAGFPAAELCRELRAIDLRQPGRARGQDAGAGRRRTLLQSRGGPDHRPHGGGERLRQGDGRAGRHPVDAGRLERHPQIQGVRRHHPARPATIPAVRTRISASNTMPRMAGRRRKNRPMRSSSFRRRSANTGLPTSSRSTSTGWVW